jgi:hypothetical protein
MDQALAVAEFTFAAMRRLEEERERKLAERIVGVDAIAAELGTHRDTVMAWARRHGLPLDRGPGREVSIRRWLLERWRADRTRAVELAKGR